MLPAASAPTPPALARTPAPRRRPAPPGVEARWEADAHLLGAAGLAAPGGVARVRDGLSDRHAGRTVAVVHPPHGPPVVYKPRALGVDAAFHALVGWLNAASPAVPTLRAVRTLDRGSHGWAEYAEPAACADAAALGRYYERAGALLALAHALRLGDLHAENVIAAGEHPVAVDLEAALAPVLRRPRPRGDPDRGTVLDTSLLPTVSLAADGRGFVASGIAARAAAPGAAVPAPHVPRAPEATLEVEAAGAAVRRGFALAYRTLVARRGALLARGGPLAAFAGARVRVVVRATAVYDAVLRRLAAPGCRSDPCARAAEVDRLERPFRGRPEWAHMARAFAAERRALLRGDVPRFELRAGGRALHADGRVVVPGYAALSGLAAVRRRVRALGPADECRQLHHVRLAFAAEAHRQECPRPCAAPGTLTPDDALAEARWLAGLLLRLAECPRGREMTRWYVRDAACGAPVLRPLDASLGHGQAGVALALAALARVDPGGAGPWAETAHAAFAPVLEAVRRGRALGRVGALGWAAGAGGIGYALALGGRWLGSGTLCEAAGAALAAGWDRADGVRPAARARPRPPGGCDVFGGVAGLALAASAVHALTGDGWTPATGAWCARALAGAVGGASRADRGAARAVRGHGVVGMSDGFGFGMAGRAVALAAAAARAGDAERARAACAVVSAAAERTAAWDGAPAGAGGWCHGPTGVALAVAAALGLPRGTAAERAHWAAALDAVAGAAARSEPPARGPYTLCCGALARVELLLSAADALGRPAYREAARAAAGALVARARRRWAYHPLPHLEPCAPGLFAGLAGLVYMLARVAAPDRVPSVLGAAPVE
jgi:lantibiotic modifying enzyme